MAVAGGSGSGVMGSFQDKLDAMMAIPVRMPTEEEKFQWAKSHVGDFEPFSIQNWPEALLDLSMDTVWMRLSKDEVEMLYAAFEASWDRKPEPLMLSAIEMFLDELLADLGTLAFVRLGSRSPKDGATDQNGKIPPVSTGKEAIDLLLSGMDRMAEDLDAARYVGTCAIVLREFIDIPLDREFRVFVEDGKIAGMSQYFFDRHFPALLERREKIDTALRDYVAGSVMSAAPWPSFTVDIALLGDDWEPLLIEVNPPWSAGRTDPCLFRGESVLDGSLRLVARGGVHGHVA